MRAEVDRREKPLEVLVALGNLYFENGRYPDAIGWYGQAIALAEPGRRRYGALPQAVRAKAKASCPSAAPRAGAPRPGYAELSAAAEAREKRRDLAGAAACWRAALAPAVAARVQRANAYLLSGDPAKAIAEHEAALADAPDDPDALWFLGLALADSAQGDVARLERARSLWHRLEQVQPGGPHAAELPVARAELERRIATAMRGR
jgi:tetratricopeptide (TPR) repeat protein